MENKTFIEAYKALENSKMKLQVREHIMKKCGWSSRTTFYDKAKGTIALRPPEEKLIKQIFQKILIDAFTGHSIKKRASSS
jgi:hypothetical protein